MFAAPLEDIVKALDGHLVGEPVKVKGVSIDSRTILSGNLFVAIEGEHFDGHLFLTEVEEKGSVAAIVHKDVSTKLPCIRVKNTEKALLKLASWWRDQFHIPCLAVTGSCGKTTVKELIYSILSCQGRAMATYGNLNNEIGVPLSLLRLEPGMAYAVFELGASKKGDISPLTQAVRPEVAVITNAAPAHIEGFKSLKGVAEAKGEIFSGLSETGTAVVNADDNFFDYWQSVASPHSVLTFGIKQAADVMASEVKLGSKGVEFCLISPLGQEVISLQTPGEHSVLNALAAAAAVIPLGVTLGSIKEGLNAYRPALPGRLMPFRAYGGAEGIDDTYNANLASVKAAISVLSQSPRKRILVLGDLAECGDKGEEIHREIGTIAHERGVHQIFTIGQLSRFSAESFGHNAQHYRNLEDLVKNLKVHLVGSVTVLVKGSRSASMERVVEAIRLQD